MAVARKSLDFLDLSEFGASIGNLSHSKLSSGGCRLSVRPPPSEPLPAPPRAVNELATSSSPEQGARGKRFRDNHSGDVGVRECAELPVVPTIAWDDGAVFVF